MQKHVRDVTPANSSFESRLEKIASWQQELVDKGVLPCAMTLVSQGGKTRFLKGTGWADIETKEPINEDSIFRMYSMTKPIVSIALMQLYEEGRFQLNDPVHMYLGPKWKKENMSVFTDWIDGDNGRKASKFETKPCETDITVAQVLTHTAGLSYGFDPSGKAITIDRIYVKTMKHPVREYRNDPSSIAASDTSMLGAFCDALANMPLLFEPGTHWNYSYGTDVCGALVEVLSGQTLDVFLEERILGPLGMVDTSFDVPPEKAHRLVHNYQYAPPEEDTPERVEGDATLTWPHIGGLRDIDKTSRPGYLRTERPKFLSGGGGLTGTIKDYSAFCSMLLAGGKAADGNRIIGRKTLEFMLSNHLPGGQRIVDMAPNAVAQYSETAKNGGAFGLGFSIVESPQSAGLIGSVGSFAWGGAASTVFWCDPSEDLHVIFCTQVMVMEPANALRSKLGSLVYGALD